jgi:hypothetical protein
MFSKIGSKKAVCRVMDSEELEEDEEEEDGDSGADMSDSEAEEEAALKTPQKRAKPTAKADKSLPAKRR